MSLNPNDVRAPESEETAPSLPGTAEEWLRHLTGLPAKELLQLLNEDKARANRIFAGFRPSGDALKNPRVTGRIIDEATRQQKFAESLFALAPRPKPAPPVPVKTAPATAAREIENLKKEVGILRESLEKRKVALQAKEMELRELKAALTQAEHERDLARQSVAQARVALTQAEEDAARLRHQLRRDERREESREKKAPTVETAAAARISPPLAMTPASAPRSSLLVEGAERLLRRARYAAVIDLCREALNADAAREDSAGRGAIHALFAAGLYGQGQIAAGEEQSRLAITALLDGGDLSGATEAVTRFLSEAKTIRKSDGESVRRLAQLGRRSGMAEYIASRFRQLRLRSRIGYQRLTELLGGAGKDLLAESGANEQIGPDQAIILPAYNASPLTPRRLVQAVEAGEASLIVRVRQGIAALRTAGEAGARRADALLEAIAGLEPAAVEPLLRQTTGAVIVDASNVARFNPDPLSLSFVPRTAHLRIMRDYLLRAGFFPIRMIADANLGHYVDDRAGYQALVARDIVREVPGGNSADDEILREARSLNAPIVSNDTFSDHEDVEGLPRLGFHIVGATVGLIPH